MRRTILTALLLLCLPTAASALCLLEGTGNHGPGWDDWDGTTSGTCSGAGGGPATTEDLEYAAGSDVTVLGSPSQGTTAGTGITVSGALTIDVLSSATGSRGLGFGPRGLEIASTATLDLVPAFYPFETTEEGESATLTRRATPSTWTVPAVVLCPGADCTKMQIDFSSTSLDPPSISGHASDSHPTEWIDLVGQDVSAGVVLGFFDAAPLDATGPAEAYMKFEVTGVCAPSDDCIEIDVTQGAGVDYPQAIREILQPASRYDVPRGQDYIVLDPSFIDDSGATATVPDNCDAANRCDQTFNSFVGRYLEPTLGVAYMIVKTEDQVDCNGADDLVDTADDDLRCSAADRASATPGQAVDVLSILDADFGGGFRESIAATDVVPVTYGIVPGDTFWLASLPKFTSTTATGADSPVSIEGPVDIGGAWFQGIGVGASNPNPISGTGAPFFAVGPDADGSTFSYLWIQNGSSDGENHLGIRLQASRTTWRDATMSGGALDANTGVHAFWFQGDVDGTDLDGFGFRHVNEQFAFTGGGATSGTIKATRIHSSWVDQDADSTNWAALLDGVTFRLSESVCIGCTTAYDSAKLFTASGNQTENMIGSKLLSVGNGAVCTSSVVGSFTDFVSLGGSGGLAICSFTNSASLMGYGNVAAAQVVGGGGVAGVPPQTLRNVLVDSYETEAVTPGLLQTGDVHDNVMLVDVCNSAGTGVDVYEEAASAGPVGRIANVTVAFDEGCEETWGGSAISIRDMTLQIPDTRYSGNMMVGLTSTAPTTTSTFAVSVSSDAERQALMDQTLNDWCWGENGNERDFFPSTNNLTLFTKVTRAVPFAFVDEERGDFTPAKGSAADLAKCGAGRTAGVGVSSGFWGLGMADLPPIRRGHPISGGGEGACPAPGCASPEG